MTCPVFKHPFFRLRAPVAKRLVLLGVGISIASSLGFLGAWHWTLDLLTHFRIQYFWGLLAIGVWLLVLRKRAWAALFLAVAALNLALLLPFYLDKPKPLHHASEPLRAMLVNVNRDHGNPQKVLDAIRAQNPDFIVLLEIDAKWFDLIAPALAENYPKPLMESRPDNFGVGVWCRHPLASTFTLHSGLFAIPSIFAEYATPQGNCVIVATHPLPPVGRTNTKSRDEQLGELARFAAKADAPLLLLGDLNATPWCGAFKNHLRASGLRNTSQGRGLYPSWPAPLPAFLRIPIDHVFHTPDIEILSRHIGPRVGSDHLPVIVDFKLPSK
ncbi:MAG: endonuclease/exonuclease/phosphatase family protein [Kiritimatiellaeota bacterium]|nr:endonuclease/exonuclease/phosphatase family protein [Kiritimatiellota bacterium]